MTQIQNKKKPILPVDAFASPIEYPTLIYVVAKLNEMDNRRHKTYLSKIITVFNQIIKIIENVDKAHIYNSYIVLLLRDSYVNKINKIEYIDEIFKDHLKNYIFAKTRKILREEIIKRKFIIKQKRGETNEKIYRN